MNDDSAVTPLVTERLLIRQMTVDDQDVIASTRTDPAVMEHNGNGRPLSRADVEATVLTYHVHFREHQYWAWAVIGPGPSHRSPLVKCSGS